MPGFVGARIGTTTQQGYGAAHQKARRQAFRLLPTWSPCRRCGQPMYKWATDQRGRSLLHYDHNDSNTAYLGFSHAQCNYKDGARKGQRAQALHRKQGTPKARHSRAGGRPGPGW